MRCLNDRSPARWRWNQTTQITAEARLHVLSHEAVLMNSLRRMLAEVPQLESKLGLWVGSKSPAALKAANKLDSSANHQPSSPGHGKTCLFVLVLSLKLQIEVCLYKMKCAVHSKLYCDTSQARYLH